MNLNSKLFFGACFSCLFFFTNTFAQYSVSITPSSATVNDNITITFTDFDLDNDFYTNGQTSIYLYAGLETTAGSWQLIHGDINDKATLGEANGGSGTFTIDIKPANFFNVPNGTQVLGIDLLFINQWGPGGNNQTTDLYIDLVDALFEIVSLTPSLPTDSEMVTIDFDASCTDLAGASKVYFHSGVSITESSPTKFDRAVGNWGQDDGVGEMTNMGGDMWQITLSSLRSYYGVDVTEDVFGLNFLFRSADGSLKEDNEGANYFNDVDTGPYFTITSPEDDPFLIPISTPFDAEAMASIAPTDWTLDEVDADGNVITPMIATQMGLTTFTHSLNLSSTDLKRYKITASFTGPLVKYKFFTVKPYGPINLAARPAWTEVGINYHTTDPTKVTLVLHAPTYTTYKDGTGATTGTSNTPSKNVVYVVGGFNNWTLDEAYKMNRDRDGWDGVTDADGDNDRGDYWWIELSGLTPGQEYIFQYFLEGAIQVADPYAEKISDPDDWAIPNTTYPGLITYPSEDAQDRAAIFQTNQSTYNWTAAPFTKPSTNNLNIYELHFRDFTEEGTYLAAIDKLDYIKELGINAIHVMPVSEFEGNSSWGYNPNFYFAPDKAYGTKDDLKKFIDECHKRKIQVFNDLVLNHCFFSNVMARMYWNEADSKPANDNPWLNPEHKMIANPGGWWGADWNHESEHTQKWIDRALDFWLQEYNFDGFRFDFTKGFGQTAQDPGDDWASSKDDDRIDLLKRMVDGMWARNPGSVAIFEHLAESSEDKILADHGILMWSGVGHHNDMKGFILGWDADNTDIYHSGIYDATGRNFMYANWMSYMESHDEERLAYELMTYGNGIKDEADPTLKVAKTINRLKIGAAFNLLFPGPRMIWQFEELGYDVSIDFNGRTGEKPVRWDYYDDLKRRELYTLMATLFYLRNNYTLYATTPDYGNIGLGAGNITTPRRMELHDGSGNYVIVIANLDPDAMHTVTPGYDVTGTWYRYNGDPNVDGTNYTVNSTGDTYDLASSEALVLTNFEVNLPLAVKLLSFKGRVANQQAILEWTTAKEANNKGFYIEKSLDAKTFESIGFMRAQGNNSSYQFLDKNFQKSAYYCLRQLDFDGATTRSNVIFLAFKQEPQATFYVYPNPVSEESILTANIPILEEIKVELFTNKASLIVQTKGDLTTINQELQAYLKPLESGVYFVRVFDKTGAQVLKVVKD